MSVPKIDVIAAVAANGVIGADGGMPFRLSTDLRRFKALTLGKPVIMGRKTYDSIGKALPGRLNIVITRSQSFSPADAAVARSLDDALAIAARQAEADGVDTICVIGGGEIYALAMSRADQLLITHIEAEIGGDTFFPPIDAGRFEAESEQHVPAGEKDSHATRYVVYRKRLTKLS
jgi:dihydrofolate reductase